MSNAVVEMPETMTGGCMCRAVRYRIFRAAGRRGTVPLQSVPAAIGKCLLDGHHHQALDLQAGGRNCSLRGCRRERLPRAPPVLSALRLAAHNRNGRGADDDVRQSRRYRLK
jgi:hypothetical protein